MDIALEQLPQDLRSAVTALLQRAQRLEQENKVLRQVLRLARIEKYGRSSEKLTDEQLSLLDAEPSVTAGEVAQEAALAQAKPEEAAGRPPKRQKPRPANLDHPGREKLPAHLERRVETIPCQSEDCHCSVCGGETKVIGYEETEELDIKPIEYFVKVIRREKRACPRHPEGGVSTAACPPKILPKSKLSDRLIIDVLIKKYADYLPVYRQCLGLERDADVEISRKTLVEAILKVGELLQAFRPVLREDLFAGGYIQADESPVPCQSERTKGRNHQAYMWEYSRPGGPVVFDFRMGRQRAGPEEFLKDFTGKLQTDGYAGYDKLGSRITHAGCWTHARRGFHRAQKVAPGEPHSLEILGLISQLYAVEEEARREQMSFACRLQLRQSKSRPLVEQIKTRILAIRQEVMPKSLVGRACHYALSQWTRLVVFLDHGELEIDNNWCENAIRSIAMGRKNWLHIGSEQAGPKIAAIASIFETCRRLGINVRNYLTDILPKMADWPSNRVAELSPMAWKAAATS